MPYSAKTEKIFWMKDSATCFSKWYPDFHLFCLGRGAGQQTRPINRPEGVALSCDSLWLLLLSKTLGFWISRRGAGDGEPSGCILVYLGLSGPASGCQANY